MITQTGEYSLRAAVFLAQRKTGKPATAAEISASTHVPLGYLQKILRQLSKRGMLNAQRGSGGGFELAKPASEITIFDILAATDNAPAGIDKCPLGIKGHTSLCPLHKMLDDAINHISQVFRETSLDDLVIAGDSGIRSLCEGANRNQQSVGLTSSGRAVINLEKS